MFYGLGKCRRILRKGVALYNKKGAVLTESDRKKFEQLLANLDEAVFTKKKGEAATLAREIEGFCKVHFPKTFFDHTKELIFALAFAVVVAFVIRQCWFELYEVPTGSMRPTVEELDRLVVSKTTFGFNLPFQRGLILSDKNALKRAGIIVFTVRDMDVADADTVYFYLFPGKKRYIKRCMGRPGDTVYFYGGLIYGIDKEGKPFTELADQSFLEKIGIEDIDHIPYISMEGKSFYTKPVAYGSYGQTDIYQMNQPVAKLELQPGGKIAGKFFNGVKWVDDTPSALKEPRTTPVSYSDLWGIGNYAMARLLTKKEVQNFYRLNLPEAPLYLELRHTPNLTYPIPEMRRNELGKIAPSITPMVAVIPLETRHLRTIQDALYTARFFIKDGHAYRYHEGDQRVQRPDFDPLFPDVPNGCYEFYYGEGYAIHWGGIATSLPANHPLYSTQPENIQKLFNLGIAFNLLFQPAAPNQPFVPQRFAYYRNGDLYLMGEPIIKKEDPALISFIAKEKERERLSSVNEPYIAFVDHGPPLNSDGSIDATFIQAFGLPIPDDSLLALGDNYAMSADSRDFGFVPWKNLRGAPLFTFWPPGPRIGALPQPATSWVTVPNAIVFVVLLGVTIGWRIVHIKRTKTRYFRK